MGYLFAGTLGLFALLTTCASDNRRPIYNMAHMVNSIGEITFYLDLGANMLEFDIQLNSNGSVKEVYHGFPCDFGRYCDNRANLQQYLEYLRNITDPSTPSNYADQMVMQYFDLKLKDGIDAKEAGRDVARHVMDFLWTEDGQRKTQVRALIDINDVKYNATIMGFIEEFKNRGQESRLKDVGFDGGQSKIEAIRKMFDTLGLQDNIWFGDGNTNYISAIIPEDRLKEGIKLRDTTGPFKKVYQWTIDLAFVMKRSLIVLGVDSFITNQPSLLKQVVENYCNNTCKLATPQDDPFERFEG